MSVGRSGGKESVKLWVCHSLVWLTPRVGAGYLHQTLLSAYLQGAGPARCLPLTALDWAKSRDLLLMMVVVSPLWA